MLGELSGLSLRNNEMTLQVFHSILTDNLIANEIDLENELKTLRIKETIINGLLDFIT
jgi:hypothetical protein